MLLFFYLSKPANHRALVNDLNDLCNGLAKLSDVQTVGPYYETI